MASVTSSSRTDKAKALDYTSPLAPIASATYNQELSVFTKVVKEFETLRKYKLAIGSLGIVGITITLLRK